MLGFIIQPTQIPKASFQCISFANPFLSNKNSLIVIFVVLMLFLYFTLTDGCCLFLQRITTALAELIVAAAVQINCQKLPETFIENKTYMKKFSSPGVKALMRAPKEYDLEALNWRDSSIGWVLRCSVSHGNQKWIGSGSTEPSARKNRFSPKHQRK